jgi:phosphoribosylanthranilate isomerase
MVRVKICGITNARDARSAIDLGAAALGFNFYEKSPRAVAPAEAWQIRQTMPKDLQAVGVFVNWDPGAVLPLATALKLSAVQLHGDELPGDAATCARTVAVIKAFRVGNGFSLAAFGKFRCASWFLLDAARAGQYGGTGHTTNWDVARKAALKHPIILAGGLSPENVTEAILAVRPYAVDVASGVESKPGKKDHGKMREFIREVERANRELGKQKNKEAKNNEVTK